MNTERKKRAERAGKLLTAGLAAVWVFYLLADIYALVIFWDPPGFLELVSAAVVFYFILTGKKAARWIFHLFTLLELAATAAILFFAYRPVFVHAVSAWRYDLPVRGILWLYVLLRTLLSAGMIFNKDVKYFLEKRREEHPKIVERPLVLLMACLVVFVTAGAALVSVFYHY